MITMIFADCLLDVQEWRNHPGGASVQLVLFLALFAFLSYFLYAQVPLFLALMACPPNVDHKNMRYLFGVLFDGQTLRTVATPPSGDAKKDGASIGRELDAPTRLATADPQFSI